MDIVLDFDGTVVTHEFPQIGKEIGAVPVLRKLIDKGHNLILFTMRSDGESGQYLTDALMWFQSYNIPLYGVQTNPDQKKWTSSPKAYGQLIIDDAALGCPLTVNISKSNRPYVDWQLVEYFLTKQGII